METYYQNKSNKDCILYNGIKPIIDNFEYSGRVNGKFVVGVLGTFSKVKGQLHLLKAVNSIKKQLPKNDQIEIKLVGPIYDGDDFWLQRAKKYAHDNFEKDEVVFEMFREDVQNVYKELSLVVVPSIMFDPFPTVVLEGMSLGVPVVGYKSGGIIESLNNDVDCLIDQGDYSALGRCILNFYTNEDLLLQKSKIQKEYYKENYNYGKYREKLLGVLDQYVTE